MCECKKREIPSNVGHGKVLRSFTVVISIFSFRTLANTARTDMNLLEGCSYFILDDARILGPRIKAQASKDANRIF